MKQLRSCFLFYLIVLLAETRSLVCTMKSQDFSFRKFAINKAKCTIIPEDFKIKNWIGLKNQDPVKNMFLISSLKGTV